MKSKVKRIVSLFLALVIVTSLSASVLAIDSAGETMINEGKYLPSEVAAALQSIERGAKVRSDIMDEVLMPSSMGIQTPNLDMRRIAQTVDVFTLNSAFAEALAEHGIKGYTGMTYSEYEVFENTWLLPTEIIKSAKTTYPELEKVDMANWTYGMYKAFYTAREQERMLEALTAEQMLNLEYRGIQLYDLSYLFKEYHTIENILSQSDEDIKGIIEGQYKFALSKVMDSANVARASAPADKYTFVLFPRYNSGNGDYFHNDVLTTAYWQQIQADRALKAQQVLYNSSSTTLKCTNMYGTYSVSQGGAHEGLDFVHPSGTSTPTIYALFNGSKQTTSTTHQLSVYDVNSPDEPKTYTFMHMSSITAGTNVTAGASVGKQGKEGNATGYHVHFEVHAGQTTSLSTGTDHVLGSLSPYRLQDYIGELS